MNGMLPTSSRDPSLIQQPTHSPNPIYFTLIDGIIVNTPSHSFLFIHSLDSSITLSMYSPLHSSLHSRISSILSYIHSLMSRVRGSGSHKAYTAWFERACGHKLVYHRHTYVCIWWGSPTETDPKPLRCMQVAQQKYASTTQEILTCVKINSALRYILTCAKINLNVL